MSDITQAQLDDVNKRFEYLIHELEWIGSAAVETFQKTQNKAYREIANAAALLIVFLEDTIQRSIHKPKTIN